MNRFIASLAIIAVFATHAGAAPVAYSVQDLGTFAGSNGLCSPNGVNSYGQRHTSKGLPSRPRSGLPLSPRRFLLFGGNVP
jgi:hypothetical protein